MPDLGNLAQNIGAATAFVVAVTALCVQAQRMITKLTTMIAAIKKQSDKVVEVHEMVNGQRGELNARIDQLTAALTASDTAVPDRAALRLGLTQPPGLPAAETGPAQVGESRADPVP